VQIWVAGGSGRPSRSGFGRRRRAIQRQPSRQPEAGDLECDLVHKALAQARNDKSQAARLLEVPRGRLYPLLEKHGPTD